VTVSGTVTANGGAGTTAGGDGGDIDIGSNTEGLVALTATAVLRANGGALNGDGGTIDLIAAGAAGANVTQAAGSSVQANASGTGTAGTITVD
jgi:hypothetical protein